jgi:hypothetical protein
VPRLSAGILLAAALTGSVAWTEQTVDAEAQANITGLNFQATVIFEG